MEETMPKQTLSIDLDSALVERVRQYSEQHGTGVADTIGELISTLPGSAHTNGTGEIPDEGDTEWEERLPPITRSLLGAASSDVSEDDYKEYLWRKHGP
jgi:hypothetical protein